MEIEDLELVVGGDPEALRRVYDSYVSHVYGAIFAILKNHQDTQECCNDLFLQLPVVLRHFDTSERLEPWLYRVAQNRARNFLRARAVRVEREVVSLDCVAEDCLCIRDDPEQIQLQKEALDAVRSAIRSFGRNRDIESFVLFFFGEFTYKEIATFLRVGQDTPKAMVNRARKAILRRIGEMYPELIE